ncbi:GSTT1.2 family protein [Megaselia abdita]
MSSPVKYFFDLMSQPSRAMYIIFKLSGSKVQNVPVALRKGEHLTEKFRDEVNKFQKVPCIVDGDFKLAESIAILRYMARKEEIKETLYPISEKSSRLLSKVDEFLEWQHLTLRLSCGSAFRMKWLEPMMGIQREEKQIKEFEKLMEVNLNIMENVWLKDTPFVTGNELTAADIFGACEIEQTSEFFVFNFVFNFKLYFSRTLWIQCWNQ